MSSVHPAARPHALERQETNAESLLRRYEMVRGLSERICEPLAVEDYQLQSILETSPPKWHLAHVSWFFETFVLACFQRDYRPFHEQFGYLFNSYYYTVGNMHPRPQRGLLSRPTLTEVFDYRRHVDERMRRLLDTLDGTQWEDLSARVVLGLHHEQQHQELMLMDIKHNFSVNPLLPAYRSDLPVSSCEASPLGWLDGKGGIHEIGDGGEGFSFDNERPRHRVLLQDYRLADRLTTNGEFLDFIQDGGYRRPELWLSDGWALIRQRDWRHPLYWIDEGGVWRQFTLGGPRLLNVHEPVCHLSYYEADAYARWAGKRLPSEAELELMLELRGACCDGNFLESGYLHPMPAGNGGQWAGDLWSWTASNYAAYPGFKPLNGAMGEYNGKFMSNQMVLKGGCCVTPRDHIRASYRNFFYPHDRWPFTGLRLAEDA